MNDLHATEHVSDRRNRGHTRFEHGQQLAGHPNREPMLAALRDLFDACTSDGRIRFDYDTRIHVGTVN
jgi:hypothetical protein